MPTAPTLARPAPSSTSRGYDLGLVFAAVSVAAVLLYMAITVLADPARVDVVVRNPTDFPVNVEVRSAEGGNRLLLGSVASSTDHRFVDVIDQGDRWVIEYSYAGADAGSSEVGQRELADPVVVPDDVGDVLRDAGLSPPPS